MDSIRLLFFKGLHLERVLSGFAMACLMLFNGFQDGWSQRLPAGDHIDYGDIAEQVFPVLDSELGYEEWYEQFLLNRAHPADLNEITAGELKALHILSDRQVENLLRHRERHGKILSMYELQGVDEFTPGLIRLLNQLLTVDDGTTFGWEGLGRRMAALSDAYVVTRMEGMVQQLSLIHI